MALDRDAQALARLITGNNHDSLKQERAIQAETAARQQESDLARASTQADLDMAMQTRGQLPAGSDIGVKGIRLNTPDPQDALRQLILGRQLRQRVLTPAEVAAEGVGGKKVAEYEISGGRPAADKAAAALSEVESDLTSGKRDKYDQTVGAMFGNWPSILGVVGPTEKARRDKAHNTALGLAKVNDPNPTEKQQQAIMGQVYDPASDNKANADRISSFKIEQAAKQAQIEAAAANYHKTGYATIGNPQAAPQQQQAPSGPPAAPKKQYSPSRNQTRFVYPDGRVEIKDGKH